MYSSFQLARKYLNYLTTASNGKGHGTHSPFVFDFIIHVLRDRKKYEAYSRIEPIRKQMLSDSREIEVADFGAGSAILYSQKRMVKDIASSSLKKKKYGQLLFRIARYYNPKQIVELGTSLGITTSYLAAAQPKAQVYTLEGSENIAAIAQKNFEAAGLNNISLIKGDFRQTLSPLLEKMETVELVFIDGNHRKEPTLNYFQQFLPKAHNDTLFIFDDIHWSEGMENAWKNIQEHPDVTLTFDLFFLGLVFFRKEIKQKQHFIIRF